MLRFYEQLYISPNIRNAAALKWRIRHNAGSLALWLIVAPADALHGREDGEQLDIVHCGVLHQKYWRRFVRQHGLIVIGMAEGRSEVLQLVAEITQDCLDQTGSCDLLSFLFPGASCC